MRYGNLCILSKCLLWFISNCSSTFIHEHPPTDFKCTCLIFMCVAVFWSHIHGTTVEFVLFQWEIFQAHQDLNVVESHAEHKAEKNCPPQEVPRIHCDHRLAQYHVQFLWVNFKLAIQYRIFFLLVTSYLAGQDISCLTNDQHCIQPTSHLHSLCLSVQFHIPL
jgi:hypothetical protein